MGLVNVATDKTAFDQPYDPISASGMLRFARSIDDLLNDTLNGEEAFNRQLFTVSTELAISGGVLAAPSLAQHTVAAESGTADELDTIGSSNNSFLVLKAKAGHTIVLRHGFGNIWSASGSGAVLSGNRGLMLWCQGGQWSMIGVKTPLTNKSANTDPSSGDDAGAGYSVGSIWVNTARDRAWICVDATTGVAVWKPINKWKNSGAVRAAATTFVGIGCEVDNLGTLANANDAVDTWVSCTSSGGGAGATAGTRDFTSGAANPRQRPSYDPVLEIRIKTSANLTSQRIWLGLGGATDADTLATEIIGFRYSSVAGDAGWIPVLNNGSSQTNGSAIGTVQASTVYDFRIRIESAIPRAFLSVNGSAEQILSTNFPAISTQMGMFVRLFEQSGGARAVSVSRLKVIW